MDIEDIKLRVKVAIELFLLNHKELIEKRVSENAINHKLAEIMKFFFHNYNIDTEYNKAHFNPKNLRLDDSKFTMSDWKTKNRQLFEKLYFKINRLGANSINSLEDDFNKKKNGKFRKQIRPDIIIHIRSSRENINIVPRNLLIIEVKAKFSSKNFLFDLIKMFYYKTGYLGYNYCLFIDLSKYPKKPYKLIWYYSEQNGNRWEIEYNNTINQNIVEKCGNAISKAYVDTCKSFLS